MPGITFDTDALARVAAANKAAPQVLRATMTAAARRIVVPAFREEMRKRGRGMQKRLLIPGSYARAGFSGFELTAGVSGETLSHGGRASELARPYEFGTSIHRAKTYTATRGGTRYRVTRNTTAQLPSRASGGWVVYPAGGAVLRRAVELYVQVAVKVLADAMEGK